MTPSQPRVSVIIPTLNEEKGIVGMLAQFTPTIRRQFQLEIIVSDGGSSDQTLALARPHCDQCIVHTHPFRQTISAGRNAGAAVAQGEILLFFNADVRFPQPVEDFLEALLQAVAERGIATCRVQVYPEQKQWQDRLVLGTCNVLFWGMNALGRGMGRGECHALQRTLFDRVGGYDEALVAGEDFDLYDRCAAALRAANRPKIAFLWDQMIYEDPRRYRQQGYARTMLNWFLNFLTILFTKQSYSREWAPIR